MKDEAQYRMNIQFRNDIGHYKQFDENDNVVDYGTMSMPDDYMIFHSDLTGIKKTLKTNIK